MSRTGLGASLLDAATLLKLALRCWSCRYDARVAAALLDCYQATEVGTVVLEMAPRCWIYCQCRAAEFGTAPLELL